MTRTKKRILIILLILVLLPLFIGLIWWNLPVKRINIHGFQKPDSFVQLNLNAESGQLSRNIILQQVETFVINEIPPGLKRNIARIGLPVLFPQKIYISLDSNEEDGYDFIFVMDFGNSSKLLHKFKDKIESNLFDGNPIDITSENGYRFVSRNSLDDSSEMQVNACVWIDSGLVFASNKEILLSMVQDYNQTDVKESSDTAPLVISLNNRKSFLTRKIQEYEEKFNYEIFSSIKAIHSVDMEITPIDMDSLNCAIIFHSDKQVREDDIMISDTEFFYGILRRGAKPQGLDIRGEQTYQGKDIKLVFQVKGLSKTSSMIENLSNLFN